MKKIINFIFSTILAICLIIISFINIFSSTIFREEYVLKTLEKEDYFNNIYWLINANFENYIYQSGLEEEVLENIITKEKVKNDIKITIGNIYNQKNEEIDTSEIKEKLYKNIENSLNTISSSQKNAINEFIDQICKEYKSIISNYNIEKKVDLNIKEILDFINFVKNELLIFIGIDFLILLVLNLNRVYKFVSWIGVSFLTNGFIMLFTDIFIRLKIKIKTITIINDFVSQILRKTIFNILGIITKYGIIYIVFGILLIIIANAMHNKKMKQKKNEK